jgi:hypothetical protein
MAEKSMTLKFSLRENLPRGFRINLEYPELPAAVRFLEGFEFTKYESRGEFEKELEKFPEYLDSQNLERSPDAALSEGLFLEEADGIEGVLNVYTRSDENGCGRCWFGSFGPQKKLDEYFDLQRKARNQEVDDEW